MTKIIAFAIGLYLFAPSVYSYAKDTYSEMKRSSINIDELPTHNHAVFAKGRYCTDYLKFECLPESRDENWQRDINESLENPITSDDHEQEHQLNLKNEKIEEKMGHYTISKADDAIFKRIEFKSFLTEMEEDMEKHYPGFWGDTPKPVRYRWMRLCVAKANKYGYGLDEKDTDGTIIPANIRETGQFIELCGRIGLYFDSDPKWQYIVDFIKINKDGACAGSACDYIDFTIYGKDKDSAGNKYTDWYLQEALRYLPYPNRTVPSINDPE
jgi:hypothetical protein